MTMAEASVRLQLALTRKRAAEARCRTAFFDEVAEMPTLQVQDARMLRAAREEFENCKKAVFEAARMM
jgi:hypothetical protein